MGWIAILIVGNSINLPGIIVFSLFLCCIRPLILCYQFCSSIILPITTSSLFIASVFCQKDHNMGKSSLLMLGGFIRQILSKLSSEKENLF